MLLQRYGKAAVSVSDEETSVLGFNKAGCSE